ncbi:MAG: DUF362 domain-containing protein [Pseudodesulfovibrio sp.]|uniref:DUF362 domain-containing protein n=1 Tax=Pseudodesulfovibrio aespoeensis (strain ATCC 700646 / DSM 10631 / Aspo-2) TaxID=643562 RepID=E6VTT1_PSEA9|nr:MULTISPECIES: DUF362 domain-containing protein [Pseudodesulfovibrio]MBU4190990.1 DUF362 domain-containing protein [Pseudomonadota bacterium]ADU63368.1 protein of unknown function DUF362 [Pseudodesulfovibrio aespoeensis Aspo-2]MBU4245198.1 DUF362 domain-containing protein [Pseudomonadota bacterium]MBU4379890.1 DUF362 domain-containing protein [Pseudomonadota bacterium]MBU4476041.1 DUF362 domain-containing protein [Pseudomonadota bacterium]
MSAETPKAAVAMTHVPDYDPARLDTAVARLLETSGLTLAPGTRVLVKPNLVAARNARHCTTHPEVVRAACAYLLDCGARVTVADSPAFGPASQVARASGLAEALAGLGLRVAGLGRPAPLALTRGGTIGLSRDALEAEAILNLPKLKVHCQMVMSGAVKNLFGCVVGFRKAFAHHHLGADRDIFTAMLMDVYAALPRTHHLMDGVHALHRDGPTGGDPFRLGLLAASASGVALDTAAYAVLGLAPGHVPLWQEAVARNMAGADPRGLVYPLDAPDRFDAAGFMLSPARALQFAPLRLLRGRVRSLLKHFTNS